MRTVGILAPRFATSVVAGTVLLGCASTQDLGTRPTADASSGEDSGVLFDGSVSAPDAAQTLDAGAPEAAVAEAGADASDGGPSNARIVLFGGTDGQIYLNDTWTFDGTQWTLINTGGPSGRSGMVAATVGGKMVVFGGSSLAGSDGSSGVLNDTWTFDGATWTQLSTPTAPSPRSGAGAAVIGGALYIYGGADSSSQLTDTWKFDGTTWSQVQTNGPTGPTPTRNVFAMGSMAGGTKAVFFGGDTGTGNFLDDTWTFDGTNWAQVPTVTAPSERALEVILPWPGGAIQWGGNTGVGPNDTWTFDGANWTQVTAPPPGGANNGPCGASAAVLDSKLFLFGGYCSSPAATTYVFDGTSWSLLEYTTHPFVPSPRTGAAMATLP